MAVTRIELGQVVDVPSEVLIGRQAAGTGALTTVALGSSLGMYDFSGAHIDTIQDIRTSATPQFNSLSVVGDAKINISYSGTQGSSSGPWMEFISSNNLVALPTGTSLARLRVSGRLPSVQMSAHHGFIQAETTGAWTSGSNPYKIDILTVPSGSAVSVSRITIFDSGEVAFNAGKGIRLYDDDSSHYIAIKPASAVANYTITLPATGPGTDTYLKHTTGGAYEWASAAGGGASSFLDLTDTTPVTYASQAGKVVVVNSGETGLEFAGPAVGTYIATMDTSTQTIINSTADTSVWSWTLPAGTLQSGTIVRIRAEGVGKNNTGGNTTLTSKTVFGSTTLASHAETFTTNSNEYVWWLEVTILYTGASSQRILSIFTQSRKANNQTAESVYYDGTASENSANAISIDLRFQHSVANSQAYITKYSTFVEILRAATGISTGGTGTVTSVALSMPAIFSVSGSPVTAAGTLAVSLASASANTFFAGPSSGGSATPAFRGIVDTDLPTIPVTKGGTGLTTLASGAMLYASASNTIAALTVGNGLAISGGTITVGGTNGLTQTSTGLKLGGTLAENTTIDGAAYQLLVTGLGAGLIQSSDGTRTSSLYASAGVGVDAAAEAAVGVQKSGVDNVFQATTTRLLARANSSTPNVDIEGSATTAATMRFLEGTNNGTNYIGIKAPNSISSDYTIALPASAPGTDTYLKHTTGGAYEWASAAGGGSPGDIDSGLVLSGDQAQSLSSGNNNDLSLTNLSTASTFRLTGSGVSESVVTGISGGADGRIAVIVNVSTYQFLIANDSSSSSAANRIICGYETSLMVPYGGSVTLRYDATLSRWFVVSHCGVMPKPVVIEATTAVSNQSVSVPRGAVKMEVRCTGGGGGGGSGRCGATSTTRLGGGGGGAGGYGVAMFNMDELSYPTQIFYTVGAGGAGAGINFSNDTNGSAGSAGGASSVGTTSGPGTVIMRSGGGGGGAGGTNGTSIVGGTSAGTVFSSSEGSLFFNTLQGGGSNNSSGSLQPAFIQSTSTTTNSAPGPGPGAGGAYISSGNGAGLGQSGAGALGQSSSKGAGGGSAGADGSAGSLPYSSAYCGGGGGGGAAYSAGSGGGGGNGTRGGGGGGGAGALNGGWGGNGGNGGAGYVRITFFFQ